MWLPIYKQRGISAMYFVVYRQHDEPTFRLMTKEVFLQELAEGGFRDVEWKNRWPAEKKYGFDMTEFPASTGFIIKGDLIVPKPVEVVKSFELP